MATFNNRNVQYYGYEIKRSKSVEKDLKKRESFATPDYTDGAITVETGLNSGFGFYGHYVDFSAQFRNERDLIRKYRDVVSIPEVDSAIDDIINEAIVTQDHEIPVEINLDNLKEQDNIKDKITEEWEYLCKILKIKTRGYEIFRRWYIDGKLYYHKIVDMDAQQKGIRELRPIDAMKMRKVREIVKKPADQGGIEVIDEVNEYYIYSENEDFINGVRISPDSITFCPSGIYDYEKKINLSHLYKAIRPANQLKMMEDAIVIYRISRAPERRIFYIDVGSLPATKAEQYVKNIMTRYRNKMVYDATTGEVRDDKRHASVLEDLWIPRREGGSATEVQTLPGGQNLSEIEDIIYFQKKLYKALNVPISRLETDNSFNLGRASEITRDELKFSKFIDRLRTKFSEMFYDMLKTQVILKKIVTPEEWDNMKYDIVFDFRKDSHFTEMKELELLQERTNIYNNMQQTVGKYYSHEWVRKNIFRMTDEDIKEQNKIIKTESKDKILYPPEEVNEDFDFLKEELDESTDV